MNTLRISIAQLEALLAAAKAEEAKGESNGIVRIAVVTESDCYTRPDEIGCSLENACASIYGRHIGTF